MAGLVRLVPAIQVLPQGCRPRASDSL